MLKQFLEHLKSNYFNSNPISNNKKKEELYCNITNYYDDFLAKQKENFLSQQAKLLCLTTEILQAVIDKRLKDTDNDSFDNISMLF